MTAGPGLVALGAAVALDPSRWVLLVLGFGLVAGITGTISGVFGRRGARPPWDGAEPLPPDAVEVSRRLRDALFLLALLAAGTAIVFGAAAAGAAALDERLSHALVLAGGTFAGTCLESVLSEMRMARWEAQNGSLFAARRFAFRKRPLYVERRSAAVE